MKTAIKTMKAPVEWEGEVITCKSYGDKDEFGEAIWYTEDGKAYELMYARRAKRYAFYPIPAYNK